MRMRMRMRRRWRGGCGVERAAAARLALLVARRAAAARLALLVARRALVALLALVVVVGTGGGNAHAATRNASAEPCGAHAPTPPLAPQSGASIALSRTKGPAGMSLSLSGTGWPAGVTIAVDEDTQLADGTLDTLGSAPVGLDTGSDGTFQTDPFVLPDLQSCVARPLHAIYFVAHTLDNSVSAEAMFTYASQPTLASTSGLQVRPGFAVLLNGQSWEPGEQVTITSGVMATPQLACEPLIPPACQQPATPVPSATTRTTADDSGNLSLTYALPDGLKPRMAVLVQATGTGPLYGTVSALPLEFLILPAVDPTITVDRTAGEAGVAVHVAGQHWYPGDTVQIEYCRGQNMMLGPKSGTGGGQGELRCDPQAAQTLGQVIVDAGGSFSTTVSVPTNARIGPITLQARVPNDVLGLLEYAQAVGFVIMPPPPPWSQQHPRLALALAIARPAAPALALAALLLAAYIWSRRRARRAAAGKAAATAGNREV